MEDILLEPYGGQILHLSVGATTKLSATLAVGGLIGFALASRVLSRGADPFRMASAAAWVGLPAFACVILSVPAGSPALFAFGVLAIGFGAGLFGHGTLTATMNSAPEEQRGLALGAWGAVQATGAGIGVAAGGALRDLASNVAEGLNLPRHEAIGYMSVYALEGLLLVMTLIAMAKLIKPVARVMARTSLETPGVQHEPVDGSAIP
jgi:BCD family chlorophyll transporter-like MFS transporter